MNNDCPSRTIPVGEVHAFAVAAFGQGMIYAVMSYYISDFYINILHLPLLFVLLLMLLARVWDSVNDPLMGILADRYAARGGRLQRFLLWGAPPVCLLTIFIFRDPGLPMSATMVCAAVIYVLWGMVYTLSDVPFWSLPNTMTASPEERGTLFGVGRASNGVGAAVPMVVFMALGIFLPKLYPQDSGIALEQRKYLWIATVCAVTGTLLFAAAGSRARERVIPVLPQKQAGQRSTLSRIFHCKPLMLVVAMGILSSGRYMLQAGAVHVARYAFYVGPQLARLGEAERTAAVSASVSIVTTVFTVCSYVGMFGAMMLMPFFYRRADYKRIVLVSCLSGAAAGGLTAVIGVMGILNGWPWTLYACVPLIVIMSVPLGVLNVTSYAMIGDCLDYLEWSTGFRDTALGSACQSFVNKLGNALATTLIVLLYMAVRLDPAQILGGASVAAPEMPVFVRVTMFSLVSAVPCISLLLCCVPLQFYDLTGEKKQRITDELSARRRLRQER